jgi:hypothetical protein
MARTAPAPNIPPIPGMCPSVAVLGGGGDGGGGGGRGARRGGGGAGAGGSGGGEGAAGDGRGAPDPHRYPDCGTVAHPVDVVTGRAFTHPFLIVALPGPLPLLWECMIGREVADWQAFAPRVVTRFVWDGDALVHERARSAARSTADQGRISSSRFAVANRRSECMVHGASLS